MNTQKPNQVLPLILQAIDTSKILWWKFFDWLAVISWSYLVFISFVVLIIAAILGLGSLVPFCVLLINLD